MTGPLSQRMPPSFSGTTCWRGSYLEAGGCLVVSSCSEWTAPEVALWSSLFLLTEKVGWSVCHPVFTPFPILGGNFSELFSFSSVPLVSHRHSGWRRHPSLSLSLFGHSPHSSTQLFIILISILPFPSSLSPSLSLSLSRLSLSITNPTNFTPTSWGLYEQTAHEEKGVEFEEETKVWVEFVVV